MTGRNKGKRRFLSRKFLYVFIRKTGFLCLNVKLIGKIATLEPVLKFLLFHEKGQEIDIKTCYLRKLLKIRFSVFYRGICRKISQWVRRAKEKLGVIAVFIKGSDALQFLFRGPEGLVYRLKRCSSDSKSFTYGSHLRS